MLSLFTERWQLVIGAVFVAFVLFMPKNANGAEAVIPPSSFASLQPFKSFPKGAGEGVAYRYEPRTKAQFVRITNAGLRESHVHDVTITRESPNYPSRT